MGAVECQSAINSVLSVVEHTYEIQWRGNVSAGTHRSCTKLDVAPARAKLSSPHLPRSASLERELPALHMRSCSRNSAYDQHTTQHLFRPAAFPGMILIDN